MPLSAQDLPAQAPGIVAPPPDAPLAPVSVILTIDQDDVFARSAFGQRLRAEVEARGAALAAENREIETRLSAEERALTDLRATLPPDEFRARAEAFDARVVELRREQDAKGRDLADLPERGRAAFWRAALPVVAGIARDRGAVAILDSRAVLISADAVDITELAIARLDAELGDGADLLAGPDTGVGPQRAP
jgi:Skp family chaperone for outer membrane proteins